MNQTLKFLYVTLSLFWATILIECNKSTQEKFSEKAFNQMAEEVSKGTVPDISVDSLSKVKKSYFLLDCREKAEYKVSHIEGAIWVGFDDFKLFRLKNIPKNAKIVTYCTVGRRSERIGEQLQKAGYSNVRNLHGSILKWMNEGYPVVDQEGKTTQKVHSYNAKYKKYSKLREVVY